MSVVTEELSEAERRTLAELSSRAGREAVERARAEGKQVGRPRVITSEDDAEIRRLKDSGVHVDTIAKAYDVHRSAIYRSLSRSSGTL
jgi:DNA invertase Pin-like site-specific DNA recombinase